jgi:asparagine synthase (glutamine-hydrolysing)
MSGVAGHWAYASRDMEDAHFKAFIHSLAHRGPDGFGTKHFPARRLWLGHRRLAIFDRSTRAQQPISLAGRYWITYNGEVYNYRALRHELVRLGYRFVSDCDSEVVLAAYAQWGPSCLFRFNGMWAFAIWDSQEQRLFLARDRFGIKPLFYAVSPGAISFASELKAFLTLPWIDGAFNSDVLIQTLADIGGQEAEPDSLLPGVHRLLASHWMQIEADGRIHVQAWWNTRDHLAPVPETLSAQVDEFRSLFFDACCLRLQGEGSLAIEQSGGLDSSAIACAVAELSRSNGVRQSSMDCQSAFVACFDGTSNDERKEAQIIINHTGMTPHFEYVDDRTAFDEIEKTIFDHEIIFLFPRVGSWALFRAMRTAGIRASLNGGAADSLLGNDRQIIELASHAALMHLQFRRYRELRIILRTFESVDASVGAALRDQFQWLARNCLARLRLLEPLRVVRDRLRGFENEAIMRVTEPPNGIHRDFYKDMAPLESAYYKTFHVDNQLHYANFDRASMAHGIQCRMPFTDWRLVSYAFALPEECKFARGLTKRVLRLALDKRMPDEVRLQPAKMPFVSPMDEWALAALKPWLLDLCASRAFLESAIWNGPAVKVATEQATVGRKSLWTIWPIINAYALEQSFKQRARLRSLQTAQKPITGLGPSCAA